MSQPRRARETGTKLTCEAKHVLMRQNQPAIWWWHDIDMGYMTALASSSVRWRQVMLRGPTWLLRRRQSRGDVLAQRLRSQQLYLGALRVLHCRQQVRQHLCILAGRLLAHHN